MTEIKNVRQAVAEWMGKEVLEDKPVGNYIAVKSLQGWSAYTPDTNAQQADELWKELEKQGYKVILSGPRYCVIINTGVYLYAEGKWWPEALARAVAELQKAKNDKPKQTGG